MLPWEMQGLKDVNHIKSAEITSIFILFFFDQLWLLFIQEAYATSFYTFFFYIPEISENSSFKYVTKLAFGAK